MTDNGMLLSDRAEKFSRFWPKVVLTPGCWWWRGAKDSYGYGLFYLRPPRVIGKAHRASYDLFVGEIPEGLQLDHLCRNRACVNPAHLEPVTSQVNTLRGTSPAARSAKRTHCARGHLLEGDNIQRPGRSRGRRCAECHRDKMRGYYHAKKVAL